MKRNSEIDKAAHRKARKTQGSIGDKSKYARKRAAGNQMYGPGCCAHKIRTSQGDWTND